MSIRVAIGLLLIGLPFATFAQATIKQKEERALNLLWSLPEVKQLIEEQKDTCCHVTIMTKQTPDKSFRYFWLGVGVLDNFMFHTIYNFYVNPSNYAILYYSTPYDTLIPLQYWRKHKDKY